MTEAEFRQVRRQKFLTSRYFGLNERRLDEREANSREGIENLRRRGNRPPAGHEGIFDARLDRIRLHYTAGRPISELRPLYLATVDALADWTEAFRGYIRELAQETGDELRDDGTGLAFESLGYYRRAVDLVSIGILLGEGSSVRRVSAFLTQYRGTDLLFEYLLSPAVDDRRDNTDFFHERPYDPLIDAFYTADSDADAIVFMQSYLEGWYPALAGLPDHDGHLKKFDYYMPYHGYWAFDAAAVSVIRGLDDTSFRDHMIYPKDLADWARQHDSLRRLAPEQVAGSSEKPRLRCAAGAACPQGGWWSTPAAPDSRRYFSQGQILPSIGGDYGTTIWQWDDDQTP